MAFMTRRKPEGGSNSLRGGKNVYSAKTKVGNWVEEERRPDVITGNFTTSRFLSTAHEGMHEGKGTSAERFGAGLPEDDSAGRYDYANVINPDREATDRNWKSMAQLSYRDPAANEPTEFSATAFKTGAPKVSGEALRKYREEWTREPEMNRERRFCTDAVISANQGARPNMQRRQLRRLPGTPRGVERIRDQVIERGGHGGIAGIRRSMRVMDDSGDLRLSREEFRGGLLDYGIAISDAELTECFNFFDVNGDGTLSFDEFLVTIRGPMNARRVAAVRLAFDKLDATGDGVVTVADLESVYDASKHPDVLEGKITENEALAQFMAQWDGSADGTATFDEFCSYYNDVSASVDDDEYFEFMINQAWQL